MSFLLIQCSEPDARPIPGSNGGGFRVVYEYANNLVMRGHVVSVVHPRCLKNMLTPTKIGKLGGIPLFFRDLMFKPDVEWQFIDERIRMMFINEPAPENVPNGDVVFAKPGRQQNMLTIILNQREKNFISYRAMKHSQVQRRELSYMEIPPEKGFHIKMALREGT